MPTPAGASVVSGATPDVVVVGGGVIGLSVAECAARRGMKVMLLERERVASRASWAGAGMLNCRPWPREKRDEPDYIDLIQASVKLHEQWAARLREETDMDVGFRRCGAVELCTEERAAQEKGLEQLERLADGCAARGVPCQRLTPADVRGVEPHVDTAGIAGALLLPDDAQIRTPRFARALALACRQREVTIIEGVAVADLCVANGRVTGVEAADGGQYNAANVVMCAGAWTAQFPALTRAAPRAGRVEPVRGQILCYQTPTPLCMRLLTVSEQYACPRPDGILLIGSTTEKVGFDAVTTLDAQAQLKLFAEALLPELRTITPFQGWADLRPGLKGLHPLLGPVPGVQGLYIAAGHYRNGLCLAPVTGEIIAALLAHAPLPVAVEPWVPKPA